MVDEVLATRPAFVGRERELAELRSALDETLGGRGQLVLVSGEPGIGKTRLGDELAEEARSHHVSVLWGRCWEGGGAPPYWPWVQILRSLVGGLEQDDLRHHLGQGAADLAHLIPELLDRLPELRTQGRSESRMDPDGARFTMFDAVTSFLKAAAAETPLVLVLDDLHAADPPTLLLLRFVARELGSVRLFVYGTYRELEARKAPESSRALAELAREGRHLPLRGLGEADVGRYLQEFSGTGPAPAFVTDLHKRTEGNPLFVTELIRLLLAEGRLEPPESDAAVIPHGVREVIGQRLDLLAEECRSVLTLASVVGREFDLPLLEKITRLTSEQLTELLDDACAAEIIVPAGKPEAYRFAHGLVRETLYEELRLARRQRLHGEVAAALEETYAPDIDDHLAEIAHQFSLADQRRNGQKTYDYTLRAADRASAQWAHEEACGHYEKALSLPQATADARGHCELLLALGAAQWRTGDVEPAKKTFVRAASEARELEEVDLLGRAALGYGGGPEIEGLGYGAPDNTMVSLLEDAIAQSSLDDPLRPRLLARLATALHWEPESEDRKRSLAEEALELADRLGDPRIVAAALAARRYAFIGPGRLSERLQEARRMQELAQRGLDKEREAQAYRWQVWDFLEAGDLVAVDRAIAAHKRVADELRQPIFRSYTSLFLAMRALMAGRFTEGEALAREALDLGVQSRGSAEAVNLFGAQRLRLLWYQGRLEELEDAIQGFIRYAPQIKSIRSAYAFISSQLGRNETARGEFDLLAANDFRDLPRDATWLAGISILAQVCADLGDQARAPKLYDLMHPYSAQNIVGGPPPAVFMGPVPYYLGILASTTGDVSIASAHFDDALAMARSMDAQPDVVLVQHAYAKLLERNGDQTKWRALEEQAVATAEHLGMDWVARQARSLLEKGPPSGVAPGQLAPFSHRGVFSKEGEYWNVGFEGRTFRLKDSKGVRYLSLLLTRPGRELHSTEFLGPFTSGDDASRELRAARASEVGGADAMIGEEILDGQARIAMREQVRRLSEEIEEARSWADPERAARLEEELNRLTESLSRDLGLGGRSRRSGSPAERARQSVARAIKSTIERIERIDSELGHHLKTTIRTGTFCSYEPDPRVPIVWQR